MESLGSPIVPEAHLAAICIVIGLGRRQLLIILLLLLVDLLFRIILRCFVLDYVLFELYCVPACKVAYYSTNCQKYVLKV